MRSVYAEKVIACSPEVILDAFTDQTHLQHWWGVSRSLIELKPGGLWTLAWDRDAQVMQYVSTGVIVQFIPGEYLKIDHLAYLNPAYMVLGPMELEIKVLKVDTTQAKINLIQSGYQYGGDWDGYYEAVQAAWPQALEGLKRYLEKSEIRS